MIDVVVDELCTSTVPKIPNISPAIGFFTTPLFENASPARFPPRSWKADPRKLNEQMNR